MRISETHLDT